MGLAGQELTALGQEHFNREAYESNGELATAALYDWAKNPALRARKAALSPVFVHHDRVYATE
jgi:hypothetical protein